MTLTHIQPDALEQELADRGVELVALAFVDHAGITRAKSVPADRLAQALERGVGSPRVLGVFQGNDLIAPAGDIARPIGDLRLVPDVDALADGGDGWGWAPADQVDEEGVPSPLCGRSFLKRTVERAHAVGLELLMAYELEWYAESSASEPAHRGPAYGLSPLEEVGGYLIEVRRRLASHGVPVEQAHAEYSPGQLEVSLGLSDALTAADRSVLARSVIRSASSRFGLQASFSPLAHAGMMGNGCHLHVSVWRDGENLLGSGDDALGLTEEGRRFVAGILRELPALVALGCASPVSYRRLGPSRWTGAFRCWGHENREAPLRFIRGSRIARPDAANVEVKTIDASGNPYVVAGAVIAAGLGGIAEDVELPAPLDVDPATMSAAEREALGLDALPGDLDAAAAALESSTILRAALGDELHGAIAAVRAGEAETTRTLDDHQLYDAYRFRY